MVITLNVLTMLLRTFTNGVTNMNNEQATHRQRQCRYATLWRWAKAPCTHPSCRVKVKHIRGYEHCTFNPDPGMFGFSHPMGKERRSHARS
jgi:hypothetical protein